MHFIKLSKVVLPMLVLFISCREQKKDTTAETVTTADSSKTQWFAQSNIYEVNLRQYTKEGTINAFAKSLPRLKEMGVEILWFMPITPIGIDGRKETKKDMGSYYAVRNYTAFNEDYGRMEDWKAFVQQAHGMGFKVITDWVANHSSPDNHWVTSHPDFYAKDSAGKMIAPFDWTDVRKLNYDNRELRDSMIAAMKFWLQETSIDGFRCDVAGEVPDDFWKDCLSQLKALNPAIFMLAEGDKPELHAVGFNASYAWSDMSAVEKFYKKEYTLAQVDSVLNHNFSIFPADAARMYFSTNHDENSWNGTEFEKFGDAYKTVAVFTQTMNRSIPLIYSGQEAANKKRLKFFTRDPIAWDTTYTMAPFYKTLLELRKSTPALAYNASYKRTASSNDAAIFAYQREKDGRKILVLLNMSKAPQQFTISDKTIDGEPVNVYTGMKEKVSSAQFFNLPAAGFVLYNY